MSFLSSFKKLFGLGRDGGRNPLENRNIIRDKDPNHVWDIIGELGDGAFGKVYKAQHKESGILAALKQVEIKADDDLEDFLVEIDILTKCKHRNVVGIHETYFFGGKLWMYIEFCGGGAVDSIMVDLEKPLNENQIRYVCYEMCQALVFIHRQHVIHRDLKAGNVLLTMDGEVKLADFGVSAISDKTLQKRDSFIGTPYWMAPEVILCETLKDTPYSYKADIWSLGITLIEFAQIEPPNHEMHPMRVLIKIQKAEPPTLDDKRKWSLQFREFLKLCLMKDPEQRPTAEELLKHPFISNPPSKKVILDLISESKAEVVETVEDLTEDEEIQEIKRHMHDDSSIDLERLSQSSIDTEKREQTPEKQVKEAEKPSISEKIEEERSVTPERPETPDTDSTKEKIPSPKKTPAPAPPPEGRERTPTPEIGERKSPSKEESTEAEKSEEGSVKSRESSESPRESPEKDDRGSPIPMSSLDETEEKVTMHEDIVEVATISPPPEFQEDIEDKLSDEGIGPSADEKSDTSSQNGSPSKITDVQIDITPTVSDIVDEIIDDVIKSASTEPSVPAVVLETIDTVIEEQMNEEFIEGKNIEIEEKDTEVAKQDSAIDTNESEDTDIVKAGGEKEQMPKRLSSVSELVSNLEKMKEAHENEKAERSVSPRGSISPREGSVSPRQKSFDDSIPEETATVSVTTVVKTDKLISEKQKSFDKEDEQLSRKKRELEIQSVKVKIADDNEAQPIESSNIDDIITINGQPVPHASTIVLNGHISKIKDSPRGEEDKVRARSESPRVENKNRDYVPQTDIDTLETKITNNVEPLDISNPDDDSSDQRSDTGSINTVDSVERDEVIKESPRNRHRGHIKPRGERSNKSQYRTLTKTRTFVINGEVVTQTTQKVVLAGEEHKSREDHLMRKQDLRELKLLQKNENKQYQDLIYKAQLAREMQDRKFETDMQSLVKNYDQDMDTLTKQQKQQVEKAEGSQSVDLKAAAKRIKIEQEKEYKMFKEKQKQDRKLMQQEFDMMAKTAKKEDVRKRKEQKEIQLQEEERCFLENQQERMDKHMKQLTETHRQKIAMLESQFLQQKQQLLRAREAAIWELEKQQLHEKHQLAKSQLKDMFFLKRHQMLTRHQKEIEQMKRSNQSKEEEMQHRHVLEKKRLPKILKQESKTRSLMFKQSLRLSVPGNPDDERSKLKQFEENEKKRMKAEQARQENKHKKQWEELVYRNETSLRELEQLQAEKRKMLMEHETQKIKELEEQYSNELREWKAMLIPRKQRLEDEFAKQRDEQEKFYGAVVMTGENTYVPRSAPNSMRHKTDSIASRHSTVI
ncbi:serine/threonine-protein kinase 10-like isoform X1 [Mercenaria mercenaria]|uniref:serine/threonine-protein kinase 10-like isoform X1 n=1 Tax=Mercenaria mercenaria TaxID=6596 RepID=UPI00234E8F90|nr:serine/threonine-protein kinase 10-like isoform X1 [Mercenaria mercenaria]